MISPLATSRRALLGVAALALAGNAPATARKHRRRFCPPPIDGTCPEGMIYAELDGRCAPAERVYAGRAWRCKKKNHPRITLFDDGTVHCCRPEGHIAKGPGRGLCWQFEPKPYCDNRSL